MLYRILIAFSCPGFAALCPGALGTGRPSRGGAEIAAAGPFPPTQGLKRVGLSTKKLLTGNETWVTARGVLVCIGEFDRLAQLGSRHVSEALHGARLWPRNGGVAVRLHPSTGGQECPGGANSPSI